MNQSTWRPCNIRSGPTSPENPGPSIMNTGPSTLDPNPSCFRAGDAGLRIGVSREDSPLA